MSNLIKSVYFHVNPDEGARKIDSDSQVLQFVPELLQQEEQEQEETSGEFQAGMNVLNMNDVRQEERERIEREASEQIQLLQEQAKQEAEALIEEAKREADQIRTDAYEEGKAQGFSEGQELARQQLEEQKEQFRLQMEQKQKELEEQELSLEPKFADIMAALIEKITGVVCQDKKEIIIYLIHQALRQLEKAKNVTLRVSKSDILMVSAHKEELRECLADGVEFDVTEDDSLEANQCIIETDNKMVDCSLDVQLQNVKEQIRLLTIL